MPGSHDGSMQQHACIRSVNPALHVFQRSFRKCRQSQRHCFTNQFLAHSIGMSLCNREASVVRLSVCLSVCLSVRPYVCLSVNFAQIATSTTQVAGSLPNLHTMVPTWARIQGVLKVKVKVKGHVIRALFCVH